jgi:hypothetical protein
MELVGTGLPHSCSYTDCSGQYEYEYSATERTNEPGPLGASSFPNKSAIRPTSSSYEGGGQYSTQSGQNSTLVASSTVYGGSDIPCTWSSCLESFRSVHDRDRHYRTVHSNNGDRPYKCLIDGCQANVTSWTRAEKLSAHNKQWHGPYHCPKLGCPRGSSRGFATQSDLDEHQVREHGGLSIAGDFTTFSSTASNQGNENMEIYTHVPTEETDGYMVTLWANYSNSRPKTPIQSVETQPILPNHATTSNPSTKTEKLDPSE